MGGDAVSAADSWKSALIAIQFYDDGECGAFDIFSSVTGRSSLLLTDRGTPNFARSPMALRCR